MYYTLFPQLLQLSILSFSNTVIGRDRDGNDVMADGSIKLKTQLKSNETLLDSETNKKPILQKTVDQGRFDIAACVGSPEKLPSIDKSISQTNSSGTKYLNTPESLESKQDYLKDELVIFDDTSSKDS